MATINSFDDVPESSSNFSNLPSFQLTDDGNTALVRILHTNRNSFEIYSTHNVPLISKAGKTWYPKVNCLRNANDDVATCPLCAAGGDFAKLTSTCCLHMIQYNIDTAGNVTPTPCVWVKSAGWIKHNILPIIDEYGDLMLDTMFKITRVGKKGDNNTTYNITACPAGKYPLDLFPVDMSVFEGYSDLGTSVWDKSFEDMVAYMQTGKFPPTVNTAAPVSPAGNAYANIPNNAPANVPDDPDWDAMIAQRNAQAQQYVPQTPAPAPAPVGTPIMPATGAPVQQIPAQQGQMPTQQTQPWAGGATQRPRRYS